MIMLASIEIKLSKAESISAIYKSFTNLEVQSKLVARITQNSTVSSSLNPAGTLVKVQTSVTTGTQYSYQVRQSSEEVVDNLLWPYHFQTAYLQHDTDQNIMSRRGTVSNCHQQIIRTLRLQHDRTPVTPCQQNVTAQHSISCSILHFKACYICYTCYKFRFKQYLTLCGILFD